jgi:hypothetical protein
MVKPRLPEEIDKLFPKEIVALIYSYVPHLPPTPKLSPQLQKELKKIQQRGSKNNAMYLKDLDDFVID